MNAMASAVELAICWIHDSRSHFSGRIARAFFVSMRTFGVISAIDQFSGAFSAMTSIGSMLRESASPPNVIGAMLSR